MRFSICRLKVSSSNLSSSICSLSSQVINHLIENYSIVAFDFDQTIVKLHTFYEGITPKNVCERKSINDFANVSIFQDIIRGLHKNNVKVAIASFGYRKVIKSYLLETLTKEEILNITILSRESMLSKVKMLKTLSVQNGNISSNKIVLFDDDKDNCKACLKEGYCAYNVDPKTGLSTSYWEKWLSEHNK